MLLQRIGVAGAVLATIAMIGCAAATSKKAEPDPTPIPTPLPGLAGTWSHIQPNSEDDIVTLYLTFLESGRFAEAFERQDGDGQRIEHWHWSGGWTATDDTIDKIWPDGDSTQSVTKDYYFADDNNTLYVNAWTDDHPRHDFNRLTRVADPLPASIDGTWSYYNDFNDIDWTLTFDDGDFSMVMVRTDGTTNFSGTYSYDRAGYAINFTELSPIIHTMSPTGAGRMALAPSPGGGIRASHIFNEPPAVDHPPYGEYWMLLERDS